MGPDPGAGPGTRSVFTEMVAANQMPANLEGRPADYTDNTTMKVVVLMTDGEHVAHDRINDAYKTGASPIYRSTGDGQYSIYQAAATGPNKYWVPHLGQWRAAAWNSGVGAAAELGADLVQPQAQLCGMAILWTRTWHHRASRSAAYTAAMNTMRSTYASVATMNGELQQSCSLAKAEGVIVYGIAFEAPTNGQQQISNCASSNAHYFSANGLEIQTAFRSIASNISQLKLTQ